MSHVKAGGASKNNRNNAGRRHGVKRFGGQTVSVGEILVRQTGSNKVAGPGTFISKDFTIHAEKAGIVSFKKIRKTHFTGKTVPRTQVAVE